MNKFIEFFGNITVDWWCFWSNARFKDAEHFNKEVDIEDSVYNFYDIQQLVRKLYANFEWTADDITELWDAMTPPPENYKIWKQEKLKDDCDGFHSLVYHCLKNSGLDCYLFCVNAIGGGHCVLLFKYNDKWYVNDYTKIYEGFKLPIAAIEDYAAKYKDKYKLKSDVFFYGVVKYDYEDGKFHRVKLKDLEGE